MPDYQKGKIYKLVSDHTDEIYIGSTIQRLCDRLGGHKRDCKVKNCTSKKLFELGKVKIILIENYSCNSKEELYKRERHYIESMICVNKNMPGRTKAEYHQDKKEEISKKMKEYRLKNKEEISKQKKEYCLKNKEEILKQKKEYYLKNKDKIKEQTKEYYLKNIDKMKECMKERNKERTICDCGVDVRKDSISKHRKSKRHINFIGI